MPNVTQTNWTKAHSVGLAAILIAIPALPWILLSAETPHPLTAWLGTLALLFLFILVAGNAVLGVWRGMLIDDRNVISLSRLQMVLWTTVVLSAFLTAALWNISLGIDEPLSIGLPTELWVLMGISTTSLVGSPLILSSKKGGQTNHSDYEQTLTLLKAQGDRADDVEAKGLLIANTKPSKARWSDALTGDETVNGAHLDLAKVQMLFFTLIVVLAYAVAIGRLFGGDDAGGVAAFPTLDDGLLTLIGISHAGYLTSKGVTHGRPPTPNNGGTS
jgi:hypothetical protein